MTNETSSSEVISNADVEGFSDFYDLLGVAKTTDADEIEIVARKLLGEYHPDVSDHGNADEIFKNINRAQDVLTDEEQRIIYDNLGHTQYVRRREEGELSLSDDFQSTSSDESDDDTTGPSKAKTAKRAGTATTVTDDTNENRSITGGLTPAFGYQSITDLDIDWTLQEWIEDTYKKTWVFRLVSITTVTALLYYWATVNPNDILNTWSIAGSISSYGLGIVVLLTAVLAGIAITVGSGILAQKRIPTIDIETDDTGTGTDNEDPAPTDSMFSTGSTENHVGGMGLNTASQTDVGDGTDTNSNAWDSTSEYNSDTGGWDSDASERVNRSVPFGKWLLGLATLMTVGGGYLGQISPWAYLDLILRGNASQTTVWLDFGSENIIELIVLLNVGYVFLMFIFAVAGVLLASHGISKEAWHDYHVESASIYPAVWDSMLVASITAFAGGLVFSQTDIIGVDPSDITPLVAEVITISNKITMVSVTIIAMIATLAILYLYGLTQ